MLKECIYQLAHSYQNIIINYKYAFQDLNRDKQNYQIYVEYSNMYEYGFRKSLSTIKSSTIHPEPSPLQHLLPPEITIEKERPLPQSQYNSKHKSFTHQLTQLQSKNQQLISIIQQKDSKIQHLQIKYSTLMKIYQQLKNGTTQNNLIEELERDKQLCVERIRKLQKQLIQSQKQLVKTIKMYEDKNIESRKLLEKLNDNITKREQKFEKELKEVTQKMKTDQQEIDRLNRTIQILGIQLSQKESEIAKTVMETQRDRTVLSQNINHLEQKYNHENRQIKDQLHGNVERVSRQLQRMVMQNGKLNEQMMMVRNVNEEMDTQLQIKNKQLIQHIYHIDCLQLKYKEMEGKQKVLQVENESYQQQIKIKNEHSKQHISKINELQQQLQSISNNNHQLQHTVQLLTSSQLQLQQWKTTHQIHIQALNKSVQSLQQHNQQQQSTIRETQAQLQKFRHRIGELDKMNANLIVKAQQRQNKAIQLQKLIQYYKEEKVIIHKQTTQKWVEMKNFYEGQIERLQTKHKSHDYHKYNNRENHQEKENVYIKFNSSFGE